MNTNFEKRRITKVVVKPDVGLLVSHEGPRDRKGTPSKVTGELVCAEPEGEFTKAMHVLGSALVRSTAAGHFEHSLRQPALEGVLKSKDLNEVTKALLKHSIKALKVTKVVIKYDGDSVSSVKIYGDFVNFKGVAIEISSPQIELNSEAIYGWEAVLLKNVETVIEKTKEFMEGKYTEIILPEDEAKNEKEEEEAEVVDETDLDEVEEPKSKKLQIKMRIESKAKAA